MRGMKTGGRSRGVPNRLTRAAVEKLAALGCDPIEGMARIALDAANPVELRAKMFAELAQYVAPKRKAIEHTVPDDAEAGRRVDTGRLTADERLQLLELMDKLAPEGTNDGGPTAH